MRILVLGATGKTGLHVVSQALVGGHSVTAFVRDASKLNITDPHLKVAVGDARNAKDVAKALSGQDAVISTLGSNEVGSDLILASTKVLIEAMHKKDVKRIIMMSSFLASPHSRQSLIFRIGSWLAKPIVVDKLSGEEILKRSDLDWTIVYATRLDGARPGKYHVLAEGEKVGANAAIARTDVATLMLALADDKKSSQKSLIVTAS